MSNRSERWAIAKANPNLLEGRKWLPLEDEQLKKDWTGGVPTDAIASSMHRTFESVIARVAKLGLGRRQRAGRKRLGVDSHTSPRRRKYYQKPQQGEGDMVQTAWPKTALPPRAIIKKRECMWCRKEFSSTGAGHRVCSPCKLRPEWGLGDGAGYHVTADTSDAYA
jgi:hypothetical protein